jgi:hypothetical protein
MTQTHPLTPPDGLLEQWYAVGNLGNWQNALTLAYRAGADQELEACCAWLPKLPPWSGNDLRKHRRPKPPSLKGEARQIIDCLIEGDCLNDDDAVTLRRVLEALPND